MGGWGVWGRVGTLIGSTKNLLSWMLCAMIGSSRQEERKAALLKVGGLKEEKGECPIFAAALPPPSELVFLSLCPYSCAGEGGHLPLPDDSAFRLVEAPRAAHHVRPASAVSASHVLCTPDPAAAARPPQLQHCLLGAPQVSPGCSTARNQQWEPLLTLLFSSHLQQLSRFLLMAACPLGSMTKDVVALVTLHYSQTENKLR